MAEAPCGGTRSGLAPGPVTRDEADRAQRLARPRLEQLGRKLAGAVAKAKGAAVAVAVAAHNSIVIVMTMMLWLMLLQQLFPELSCSRRPCSSRSPCSSRRPCSSWRPCSSRRPCSCWRFCYACRRPVPAGENAPAAGCGPAMMPGLIQAAHLTCPICLTEPIGVPPVRAWLLQSVLAQGGQHHASLSCLPLRAQSA